jgi:hypothetical protein
MEKYTPQSPVLVEYICDSCGTGKMVYVPPQVSLMVRRHGNEHKCSNADCNRLQTFHGVTYPYVKYVEVKNG